MLQSKETKGRFHEVKKMGELTKPVTELQFNEIYDSRPRTLHTPSPVPTRRNNSPRIKQTTSVKEKLSFQEVLEMNRNYKLSVEDSVKQVKQIKTSKCETVHERYITAIRKIRRNCVMTVMEIPHTL